MENLVDIGPLFVEVHDDASFMLYHGGIYEPPACSTPAVNAWPGTLVGWVSGGDAGPDYWIVRMSFGTSWGVQGYVYIHKGPGICAFSQAITFVGGP